jgi:glycosyltransferase involved in cell wall biosynthesis
MRIINIMLASVRGGVETMALRYHQAMRAAGVEVLSLGHSKGVFAEAVAAGEMAAGEFVAADALINHDPVAAWRLRALNARFRPDIVLTHGNRPTGIALLPLVGTAGKTVQVVHNFRHKPQVDRLRAAVAVSRSVSDNLRAARPGLVVFEVLNFAPLDVRPVKPAPAGTPVIGTLSRLHRNKGIDVMLRAFARLRAQGVAARPRIAGDGPDRTALTALAGELGLGSAVEFPGWVSPAADYLATLDLFAVPSRVEPFGLVVAESMAAGVPVIASRIDGPREILNGGELGRLVPPEDDAALAEAIGLAIGDWEGTLRRAAAAQAHAVDHFSLAAGEKRLRTVLEQIAPILKKRP